MSDRWTTPEPYLRRLDSAELWQCAPEPKPNVDYIITWGTKLVKPRRG